jgi:isochorismate synthase
MNLAQEGKAISLEDSLDMLLYQGLASGKAFALWRKPKATTLHYILEERPECSRVALELEYLGPGFIVHPFADQEDRKAYFIHADHHLSLPLDEALCAEDLPEELTSLSGTLNREGRKAALAQFLRKQLQGLEEKSFPKEDKERFLGLVKLGVQAIAQGNLEKIVPARTKTLPYPEDFDLGKILSKLLQTYPFSFINFFHLPQVGTWLGASPESLIETQGDYFYTMSVAGTQAAQGDNPLKSVAWTQKEIEEQALVSRYIVDCFKTIRLREYEEHGPKTILAGNLLHLRSDFKVNTKTTGFPNLGSVMLSLLHPTSAVCGMPRKEAHAFLRAHEGFDRSFYAGFLGPVQLDGETSLYVNLRTASLQQQHLVLYAGAGVTEDSDPEKEWEETELKCEIIGKFIKNPDA